MTEDNFVYASLVLRSPSDLQMPSRYSWSLLIAFEGKLDESSIQKPVLYHGVIHRNGISL